MNIATGLELARFNFSNVVEEKFAFLHDFGFTKIETLPTIVRYRKDDIEIDVYHGRQSYEIGFGIACHGERYSISEFIQVIDPKIAEEFRNPTATTQDGLADSLAKVERLVRHYCIQALQGNPEVFVVLERQRKSWAKKYELEVLAGQLRPKAHTAFRLGRYREAAELYERIRPLLSPVELKKLAVAEERSSGAGQF